MWIGHWILGLAFYACISVAIWVEGSRTSIHFVQLVKYLTLTAALITNPHPSFSLATYGELISKNILPTCLFFFGTSTQYRVHKHLASLPSAPNYALPKAIEF